MSVTSCTTCKGFGTICGRCGRARERRHARSWGTPCCRGARVKPCPSHAATVYACDVCEKTSTEKGFVNFTRAGEANGRDRYVHLCGTCGTAWKQWIEVSYDRFLESVGKRPKVDTISRADLAQKLRKQALVQAELSRKLMLGPSASTSMVSVDPAKETINLHQFANAIESGLDL